jgi:hypothetical protein
MLGPGTLRNIARLHARVEGANLAVTAAMNASQSAQRELQSALNAACEDQGMPLSSNGQGDLQIDWATGRVWLDREKLEAPA